MGDKTGISWTDSTWNPVRGCSRVSEGCRNCYAERVAARFCGPGQPYEGMIKITEKKETRRRDLADGSVVLKQHVTTNARWNGVVRMVPEHLADPLRWRKPRRIFVNSMSDLFHESLPDSAIDQVVAVMIVQALHETRGGHTMQTLTKRADRMRRYFADPATIGRVAVAAGRLMEDGDNWHDIVAFRKEGLTHPLLWWGVSVENQAAADERIPHLLATPAAVRFLSCEPLIGEVRLDDGESGWLTCRGPQSTDDEAGCCESRYVNGWCFHGIDWVIAGCESGPGARPCEVGWLRKLRDQCAAADVAFFLKQARGPGAENSTWPDGVVRPAVNYGLGAKIKLGGVIELPYLDGVQHAAMPEVHRG